MYCRLVFICEVFIFASILDITSLPSKIECMQQFPLLISILANTAVHETSSNNRIDISHVKIKSHENVYMYCCQLCKNKISRKVPVVQHWLHFEYIPVIRVRHECNLFSLFSGGNKRKIQCVIINIH